MEKKVSLKSITVSKQETFRVYQHLSSLKHDISLSEVYLARYHFTAIRRISRLILTFILARIDKVVTQVDLQLRDTIGPC